MSDFMARDLQLLEIEMIPSNLDIHLQSGGTLRLKLENPNWEKRLQSFGEILDRIRKEHPEVWELLVSSGDIEFIEGGK